MNKKLSTCPVNKSKVSLKHMPKDKKQAEYYTAKELAEKLSLNVMTIYRYIDAGKLKAFKIGKEFRIERSEFERFMNKAKTK